MTPELTRQLFDYNDWANHRALEAAAQLTDEQFVKPLGSSFSSIRDTLVHICGGEWIWLERFLGNSPSSIPNDSAIQTVAALQKHWQPQGEKLLAYVDGLTQADLDRVFEYKTLNFGIYKNPLWQSLQHLAITGPIIAARWPPCCASSASSPSSQTSCTSTANAQPAPPSPHELAVLLTSAPMEIIRTVSWMKQAARQARAENHVIGMVPTMGALHEGHLSLLRRAQSECSKVFASIFVNPTQFGPNEDLSKYPRTFEADVAKLESAGVDILFAPDAKEIYPAGFTTYVTVEGLSDRLEGRSRPGHFRGVATVVLKLFEIAQPHFAFFGRKDAQQSRILQRMLQDLNSDVELVLCPIVRESDGLALSSRNAYLNPEERRAAAVLHRALEAVR